MKRCHCGWQGRDNAYHRHATLKGLFARRNKLTSKETYPNLIPCLILLFLIIGMPIVMFVLLNGLFCK